MAQLPAIRILRDDPSTDKTFPLTTLQEMSKEFLICNCCGEEIFLHLRREYTKCYEGCGGVHCHECRELSKRCPLIDSVDGVELSPKNLDSLYFGWDDSQPLPHNLPFGRIMDRKPKKTLSKTLTQH